ncbi:MAG: hypothetical protein JO149_09575 [Gammaproteobacteria bacterium]|nr:hypothetical protein [Gammaproteobacteria bacterium]
MEDISHLTSANYNDVRQTLRSGDILLCSGNSMFSTLIKEATNSQWSHVAFILRLDVINRIMVLESVESIGVRTIPLSSYACDYNGTGKGYPGRVLLARHQQVHESDISKLSRLAIDLLGYPYHADEIVHIATRLGLATLGFHEHPDSMKQRAFLCSEYAQVCFESIGIHINYNPAGFIAPADFARDPQVKPLCYLNVGPVLAAAQSTATVSLVTHD